MSLEGEESALELWGEAADMAQRDKAIQTGQICIVQEETAFTNEILSL